MSLWPQFTDLAPRTVQIANLSTVTPTGAPSYSTTPSTYDAYVCHLRSGQFGCSDREQGQT